MKRRKNILGILTLTLSLVALPAAADLPVGIVQSKNPVQRTVTIDDQVYKVTGRTEILDLAGRPIPFEQVTTAADQGGIVELDRVSYAYDAADDVLVTLRAAPLPR